MDTGGLQRAITLNTAKATTLHLLLAKALTQQAYSQGERVNMSQVYGLSLNEEVMKARDDIRATLVSWCKLIIDEAPTAPPRHDDIESIGNFLINWSLWLAYHPAVGDCVSELTGLNNDRYYRLAHPTANSTVLLGKCPTCQAMIHAAVDRTEKNPDRLITCPDCGRAETPFGWSVESLRYSKLLDLQQASDLVSKIHRRTVKSDAIRRWVNNPDLRLQQACRLPHNRIAIYTDELLALAAQLFGKVSA